MKSVFLFCTKLRVYWCELPLFLLLALCIIYNEHSTGLYGLYLLGILCVAAIIFVFIYFFRAIAISFDEIRYIGLFSSRDRAVITEGKTVIIRVLGKRKLRITLFGNDGVNPGFDWMKATQNAPRDICLFRGKTIGGQGAIKRVLKFFGADACDFESILTEKSFSKSYENVTVTASIVDDAREIKIRMDKTV